MGDRMLYAVIDILISHLTKSQTGGYPWPRMTIACKMCVLAYKTASVCLLAVKFTYRRIAGLDSAVKQKS